MKMLFSCLFSLAAICCAAFSTILAAVSWAFDVAFSPVEALRTLLRENWASERVVVAPQLARQRSFVARLLSAVDFREQLLGLTPSRC